MTRLDTTEYLDTLALTNICWCHHSKNSKGRGQVNKMAFIEKKITYDLLEDRMKYFLYRGLQPTYLTTFLIH